MGADLGSVFAATWGGDALPDGLAAALADVVARARAEQPDLALADADLVTALARHAPAPDPLGYLAAVRAGELALATAAVLGTDGGVAALERALADTLALVTTRHAGGGHTADDLRQILREKLLVATADRPAALALYDGTGSLATWVRVTATRTFIDLGRRKDRARELATPTGTLELAGAADLSLELVKAEYREAVAAAMREAALALPAGDRHLLRQHLVGGLSIDQLGAILGLHRATAARRLARARDAYAAAVRARVAQRLGLDDRELGELFGLVHSKLDLSIRRVLESQS